MFKIVSKKEWKETQDKINELVKIVNELVEDNKEEPKPQYFGGQ